MRPIEEFFEGANTPERNAKELHAAMEYFATLYECQKQRWEEFHEMMQPENRTN